MLHLSKCKKESQYQGLCTGTVKADCYYFVGNVDKTAIVRYYGR